MTRRAAPQIAQVQVAVMLLTRLPAGRLRAGLPVPTLAQAAWAFPLVGVLVGALGGAVLALSAALGLPAYIAATLAVVIGVLATGGLHEDGLADLADGFGGGGTLARKLEIMRDSRIGSYGALALILGVGLRVQALGLLAERDLWAAIGVMIGIEAASRAGLTGMLHALPAARSDGLGQSAAGVPRAGVGAALAIGGTALVFGAGPMGALMLGATIALAQGGVAWLALRQIGGQTGDVLGAGQQIGAVSGLIAALI